MNVFGFFIVDKPVGPTSHNIVTLVRRGTGVRKVGHAGTLDRRLPPGCLFFVLVLQPG